VTFVTVQPKSVGEVVLRYFLEGVSYYVESKLEEYASDWSREMQAAADQAALHRRLKDLWCRYTEAVSKAIEGRDL